MGTHSDDLLLSPLHSGQPQSCHPQAADVTQYWRTPVSNLCWRTSKIHNLFFFLKGVRGAWSSKVCRYCNKNGQGCNCILVWLSDFHKQSSAWNVLLSCPAPRMKADALLTSLVHSHHATHYSACFQSSMLHFIAYHGRVRATRKKGHGAFPREPPQWYILCRCGCWCCRKVLVRHPKEDLELNLIST